MKILESIKKGLSVTGSLKGLAIVLFLFNAVFNIINTLVSPPVGTPPEQIKPAVSITIFAATVVFILLSVFVQGGVFSAVKDCIKSGSKSLKEFVNNGKKFYLRLFGVGVILFFFVAVLALLVIAIISLGIAVKINAIGVILGAIVGIVGLLFIFLLMLSPYALISEDSGVLNSLKRSIDVVKDNFLKVLGILLLVLIVAFLAGLLIGFIVGILGIILKGIAMQIVAAIVMSLLNTYITIFVTGSLMAFYLSASQQKPITQAV